MRPGFLLDPDVTYLNHGRYGGCSSRSSRSTGVGSASWRPAEASGRMRTSARLAALGCPAGPGRAGAVHARGRAPSGNPDELALRLFREHRIEIPVYEWEGRRLLRVSIGPYNDERDVERLELALRALL